MYESAPDSLWTSRPSLRAAWASFIFLVIMTAIVWFMLPKWIPGIYTMLFNAGVWPFGQDTSFMIFKIMEWGPKGLLAFGLLYNLYRIFLLWTIRYEVTPSRFMYHHGILVRKHDEIELHRIRDYRVLNPILSRGLGLGMVYLVTRDATYPELKIGPFVDARGVQTIIRDGVERHKQAVGFREFESH